MTNFGIRTLAVAGGFVPTNVVSQAVDLLVPVGSVIALAAVIAGLGLWLWSLVDALRIKDQIWDAAGQNKLVWTFVIILLNLLGSILYVALARPPLRRMSLSPSAGVAR